MAHQNELEITQGALGEVIVELCWSTIAIEQKALVCPVGHEEEKEGCWVHDWEATRVEEGNTEDHKHVRVAELKHELVARIDVFVVFLNKLLCATPVSCASSIGATAASIQALKAQI